MLLLLLLLLMMMIIIKIVVVVVVVIDVVVVVFHAIFYAVCHHVPNCNFRDFNYFFVHSRFRKCSFARCASTAKAIRADGGILNGKVLLIEDLLHADIFT